MAIGSVAGGSELEIPTFDIGGSINSVLPRGHVIHGYSSASNERVVKILASRTYDDDAPMLGFGVDGNAERALARSLVTYALREHAGLEFLTATQFAESEKGLIVQGRNNSRFDNIVWGNDFALYQESEDVIIAESSGGSDPNGFGRTRVMAETALEAIILLTETYHFRNRRILDLPSISLE